MKKYVVFNLFAPNFLYKAQKSHITAQDFAYLIEIKPDIFRFCNYRNVYYKLRDNITHIYSDLQQYLLKTVNQVDKSNVFYKKNFVLFDNKVENM